MNKREKARIISIIAIPFLVLSIMWLVKIIEYYNLLGEFRLGKSMFCDARSSYSV